MPAVLYLIIGASTGAILRYALQNTFLIYFANPSIGTLLANGLGSFSIGMLYPLLDSLSKDSKIFLVTGFLGSLTTLSSFLLESVQFYETKRFSLALSYFIGTLLLGILLFKLGVNLSTALRMKA